MLYLTSIEGEQYMIPENKNRSILEILFKEANEHIMNMLEEDHDYTLALRSFAKCQERIETILHAIGDDGRELLYTYQEANLTLCRMEKEELYHQGLKDCMKFMNNLGSYT